MKKPHVHAELIKAWADGAEIEYWDTTIEGWEQTAIPMWSRFNKYRIKPTKITLEQARDAWFRYWGMPPRRDPDMALVEKFLLQEK